LKQQQFTSTQLDFKQARTLKPRNAKTDADIVIQNPLSKTSSQSVILVFRGYYFLLIYQMTGTESKVKRIMTPDQLENLRKAREKANAVRRENADLRRMERETKIIEKMAKEKEIKEKYGKVKEPKKEPEPAPVPQPEESSSEEEQEVVVKKKKVIKKPKKKKVIYVDSSDDSSSEEEVVYKKKKKKTIAPPPTPVERDPYEHLDPRKRALIDRFMNGKIM